MRHIAGLRINKLVIVTLYLVAQPISAQVLIPATNEDQDAFEQQIERAAEQAAAAQLKNKSGDAKQKSSEKSKPDKAAFGTAVRLEAKKLKDASVDDRKGMGSLISSQKKKSQTQSAGNASGLGSNASSAAKDGRSSSPNLNDTGGRPEAPGQSGNRRK